MNAQAFTEAAVIFIAGVAFMNILITFMQLAVEELKKCSIMNGEREERRAKAVPFGKKKTYAVLRTDRTA